MSTDRNNSQRASILGILGIVDPENRETIVPTSIEKISAVCAARLTFANERTNPNLQTGYNPANSGWTR